MRYSREGRLNSDVPINTMRISNTLNVPGYCIINKIGWASAEADAHPK
jgi:hypothetical protein